MSLAHEGSSITVAGSFFGDFQFHPLSSTSDISQFHADCVKRAILELSWGHIVGVVVDGHKIAADVVILSMGPWGEVLQQAVPAVCLKSAGCCQRIGCGSKFKTFLYFGHFWSESAFGHPLLTCTYALISHAHWADGVFPGPRQACGMLGVKYHSVLMRSGRVLNEAGPEQSRVAGSGPGSCFTFFFMFPVWFMSLEERILSYFIHCCILDILVVVRGLWMVPKSQAVFFSGLGDPEVYPRNDGILVMLRKDPRWFRPDQSWGFVSQWQWWSYKYHHY